MEGRTVCISKCPVRGEEDTEMTAGGTLLVRLVSSVPPYKGGRREERSVRLVAPI